jgi:hypothetical protein
MNNATTHLAMRAHFHRHYPEMAAIFENAKSDEDIRALHKKYLAQAKENLLRTLSEAGLDSTDFFGVDSTADGNVVLLGELYQKMIKAKGEDIKSYIEMNLSAINSINEKDNDALQTSFKIVGGFSAAFGMRCGAQLLIAMGRAAWTFSATVTAVSTVTVAVVAAACMFIVLSIFVPILYFVFKPAQSILYLINDVPKTIEMIDSYAVHGKINTTTKMIQGNALLDDKVNPEKSIRFAGIFGAEKHPGALIGTECGFTFRYNDQDSKTTFTFGVGIGCPLMEKNRLFCAFNQSAQTIAESMSTSYGLHHEAAFGDYRLSISLNSESNSPAFFIARIYKA